MQYIGARPDRLMSCSCCGKACIEIKCPYSINYTDPNEQNLDYLYKDGDTGKLKQIKMWVTKTKNAYFVVWTTHGMVIDNVIFDNELRKQIFKENNDCKHINRKVSFFLTFLLKKPFYSHCSQTIIGPFGKS